MKVKSFKISAVIITLVICLTSCTINNPIKLIENDSSNSNYSFFNDFSVKDDTVNINCYVVLENTSNKQQTFKLIGYLPDDVGKLLVNKKIIAVNKKGEERLFTIPANTTKSFNVAFAGKYAGTYQKANKLLPEIEIQIIEN